MITLIFLLLVAGLSPVKFFEFKVWERNFLSVGLQYKFADFWVGVFGKKIDEVWNLWVCLLPMFPLHFRLYPRVVKVSIDGVEKELRRGLWQVSELSKGPLIVETASGETTEHSDTVFLRGGETIRISI